MAISCDPSRLHAELIAAGIAAGRIVSVRNGGPLDTLVWASPPTAAELATANPVLAAHDPDAAASERAAERAQLQSDYAAWNSLSAAQKDAAVKRVLGVVVRTLA